MRKQKGITLIALVITIIVLLILAGVSINVITGDDGIIQKASLAKKENDIAQDKEKINLAVSEYKIENIEDETLALEEFLESKDWCSSAVLDANSKTIIVTMINGNEYEIDVSGNVNENKELEWNTILEEANANPDSYKHSDQ